MPEFDWRDRPNASPWGGWFIQSRAGANRNNFEVVIPWPNGGLAHFYRDNGNNALQWYGPTLFATGSHYQGVSITESDDRAFQGTPAKNLEVVAVRQDGVLEHWWRENGGALTWRLGSEVAQRCSGVPAIVYSGAMFDDIILIPGAHQDSHKPGMLHVVAAGDNAGFNYYIKSTASDSRWTQVPYQSIPADSINAIIPGGKLTGMGIILTPVGANSSYSSYKGVAEDTSCAHQGQTYIVAGSEQNALLCWVTSDAYFEELSPGGVHCNWLAGDTITKPGPDIHSEELRAFYGRPSLIQGDYRQDDSGIFDEGDYGNFELVSPLKAGGLLHRARNVGSPHDLQKLTSGWGPATQFGSGLYDEVSLIQSDYGGDNGNLELVARNSCQFGFDFYWRTGITWNGPIFFGKDSGVIPIGTSTTASTQALKVLIGSLKPAEKLTALSSINVLTSIEPASEMVAWLGDPDTPYPALADALLALIVTQRLAAPVYIDVIRGFYEDDLGQPSPRSIADVHTGALRTAVLKASNENNGAELTTFEQLLA